MSLGDNKLHPLQIEDARQACYRASEAQRAVEDRIKVAARDLAAKERAYRLRLSERILALRAEGVAVTACSEIVRGESDVAQLRFDRDVAEGVLEATRQESFRRGADRRDVHELLRWSEARDLRTDTPPVREQDWSAPVGGGHG